MSDTGGDCEADLLEAIRHGDETAFDEMVKRYHPEMVRFARTSIRDAHVAEEVVQEAWLAALRSLDRFEGRSTVKTWLFGIVHNLARTAAHKEARRRAFLEAARSEVSTADPSVPSSRFQDAGEPFPGHWRVPPQEWGRDPETEILGAEVRGLVEAAIRDLPEAQQTVITLRDLNGWSSDEVCNALRISQTNQRVLLHRARTKVRRALATHYGDPT